MKTYTQETPAGLHDDRVEHDRHDGPSQPSSFIAQLPAVILTAALVIGAGVWMHNRDAAQRAIDLEAVRSQNEVLQTQTTENRRELEATTKLLKDALARHDGEVFRTDEEIQKLNDERVSMLADAVAKKVVPALPPVKTVAELEQQQQDQVDKVAHRLTDDLQPVLTNISTEQKAQSAEVMRQYENRVQELTTNLQVTQAAAQDALRLTHEVSVRYLDSFKDQGVLVRLLALPANLLIDTANLNLVTSRDRAKVDADLTAKMNEIDRRLRSVQTGTADTKG